jgi:5-oxoprolinase (ATP-hydrolysing)
MPDPQQIAANHKGIGLLHACRCYFPTFTASLIMLFIVIEEYGLAKVQEYMHHIRANAETCVRNLLKSVVKRLNTTKLSAVDYLDDGTPVCKLVWIGQATS